jgi:hypothetical protein
VANNPINVPDELHERIKKFVEMDRNSSKRAFVVECVNAICDMIEQKEGERAVPQIVREMAWRLSEGQKQEFLQETKPSSALEKNAKLLARLARKSIHDPKRPKP